MNIAMNMSTFDLIRASACIAIGWYVGRGIYAFVVELGIKVFERLSRLIA